MLNVLIVDDEPLAHDVILHHLSAHADIHVVGQCYNATEALSWLASNNVDLMFLDINMPALSGIDMLKVLRKHPEVIIVSAYQEFAIQGFELDVADYLLKPASGERVSQALDKVRARLQPTSSTTSIDEHIVVKIDREKRKYLIKDISLLEAYGNYVKLFTGEQSVLVSSSLKQLVDQLPDSQFVQVHKSFVVNKAYVVAVSTDSLTLDCGREIKAGKSFKFVLKSLF